jgi:hypothetical protein
MRNYVYVVITKTNIRSLMKPIIPVRLIMVMSFQLVGAGITRRVSEMASKEGELVNELI